MANISAIVAAIKTTLASNLPQIDQSSTDEYLPPIQTADTALIIPAFEQETEFGLTTLNGNTYAVHRIRVELWVKHAGNNASLTQRARQIAYDAVRILMENRTLGGVVLKVDSWNTLNFSNTILSRVADGLVEIGGASYCIVTISLPVTDFTPTA